jgi:hypothetical protein
MALRKGVVEDRASPTRTLDATKLMEAFHYAWEGALVGELISSNNILHAPREMLRSVLTASESAPDIQSKHLGELALAGWRWAYEEQAEFAAAVPPTDAIN